MLRNRARRHEPALAAGPARPRHRGARPGRGVPGRQRRRGPRRHPGRRARPRTPSSRRCASCRSGVSRFNTEPAHAAAHRRRGGGRRRRGRGLAGRLPATRSAAAWCSPPTSTTCWPAGRSPRPTPTRASRCTRTASAWPARSSSSSTGAPTTPTGAAGRLLRRGSTAPPTRAATPACEPRRGADRRSPRRALGRARRAVGILTGEYGARVLAPLVAASAATTCGWSPVPTSSSAATPASPA